MSRKVVKACDIKEGSFIIIGGEPCKVVEVEKSKTGKHGSAKCRIVGVGIFDSVKRNIVVPASSRIEMPVIEKGVAQVLSVVGNTVQLMDLSTYGLYELPLPDERQLEEGIREGREVEVWKIGDRRKIMRLR